MTEARASLLDALEALGPLRGAVVLVGAQAIYLHTGETPSAISPFTRDADIALDTRMLADDPRIEDAMSGAGFVLSGQPGSWVSRRGTPVDLMIADAQAGGRGRRSVDVPPHASRAARRAVGLEAAVVDNLPLSVEGLDPMTDDRSFLIRVAGPAALLVAKAHKIGERLAASRSVAAKDAHDVYRLLVSVPTGTIAEGFTRILSDPLSGAIGRGAVRFVGDLFASGPDAPGSALAGRAEEGVGAPDEVAASVAALAADVLKALD